MSNEIIVQLATGVYDGITVLRFPDGTQAKAYYKTFNGVDVTFDSNGRAWLNQAAMGRLLAVDKQAVSRTIQFLSQSGHIRNENGHVITVMTRIERGQSSYDAELPLYDQYIMNLVAARQNKPSPESIDFLEWRESIIDKHQAMIHQLRLQAMHEQGLLAEQVESLTETVTEAQKAQAQAEYWKWRGEEQARYLVAELRGELPIENWTE